MAPQELLHEVKTAPSPEVLGVFKTDAGDEYVLEQVHEVGVDLYMMYHINPEITDVVEESRELNFNDEDFRAALRVTDVLAHEPTEVHPVHLDVIVAPQSPRSIKFSLLETILNKVEENYPVSSHGAEVELHPGKIDFDVISHEAVVDQVPKQIFEQLGFTAVSTDSDGIFLVKAPEPEYVEQSAHVLAA